MKHAVGFCRGGAVSAQEDEAFCLLFLANPLRALWTDHRCFILLVLPRLESMSPTLRPPRLHAIGAHSYIHRYLRRLGYQTLQTVRAQHLLRFSTEKDLLFFLSPRRFCPLRNHLQPTYRRGGASARGGFQGCVCVLSRSEDQD